MTLNELKAKAYDCLAQIEYWNSEMQKINKAIAEYKVNEPEDIKVEEVK